MLEHKSGNISNFQVRHLCSALLSLAKSRRQCQIVAYLDAGHANVSASQIIIIVERRPDDVGYIYVIDVPGNKGRICSLLNASALTVTLDKKVIGYERLTNVRAKTGDEACLESLRTENKKLSYRRESARQLRRVFLGWLTDRAILKIAQSLMKT